MRQSWRSRCWIYSHPPEIGLDAKQSRERRRNAHRAATICAQRIGHQPGCNHRGSTAAGAARRQIGVPGIARNAGQLAVTNRFAAEFAGGRLSKNNGAGGTQPFHRGSIFCLVCIRCGAGARPHRHILDGDQILDRCGYTVQLAQFAAAQYARLTGFGLSAGTLEIGMHKHVESGFQLFIARHNSRQQFSWREVFA